MEVVGRRLPRWAFRLAVLTSLLLVTASARAQAPVVEFTGGPAEGGFSGAGATFTWSSTLSPTATGVTYAYSLDGGAYTSESSDSSATLTALAAGSHTFTVRATDDAALIGTASRTWTVDVTGPTVHFTTAPAESSYLSVTSVPLVWGGNDGDGVGVVEFASRLDGSPWSAFSATTSITLTGLTPGMHTFELRARDALGNEGATESCTFDANALVSWWNADGDADDSWGSNHGIERNGVTYTAGIRDQTWTFDGTSQYIEVPAGPSLDPGAGSFTIEAWVKTNSSLTRQIVYKAENTGTVNPSSSSGYRLTALGGFASIQIHDNDAGIAISTWSAVTGITDLQWHHIAGGRDMATGRVFLYVDGVQEVDEPLSATADGPISDLDGEADPLLIGVRRTSLTALGSYFPGEIDEVVFSTRALSGAEIAAIYAAGGRAPCNIGAQLGRTFTIDLTGPATQIVSGPAEGSTANSATATFGFVGTDDFSDPANLEFAWRTDSAPWSAFSSDTLADATGLADGAHTFEVKARDQAGNEDPTPAIRNWTVRAQAPAVAFTGGPAEGGFSGAATTFTWSSTRSPLATSLTYAWSLDGGAFTPESADSSATLTGLMAGSHTIIVRATDDAALTGTASRTWTVDTTPPVVAITGGPLGWSNGIAELAWSGSDDSGGALVYSYRMDAGPYGPYNASTSDSYAALAEGPHAFEVKARDVAGNESTPATRAFTSDYTPPTTMIVGGPAEGSTVVTSSVTLTVDGTDNFTSPAQLQYQSRVDGGAWSTLVASTSLVISGLAEGSHLIEVRSRDLATNVDASPASLGLTVHTEAPAKFVVLGPPPSTNQTSVQFAFSSTSNQPANTIQYSHRIDGAAWSAYGSDTTASYSGLAEGAHVFGLRARDGYGLEDSIDTNFAVDLTAPETFIGLDLGPWSDSTTFTITFGGTDDLAFTLQLEFEWSVDGGPYSARSSATSITLNDLEPGSHTFAVRATDAAGNTDATPAAHAFTVDLVAPETQLASAPDEGAIVDGTTVSFAWTGSDDAAIAAQLAFSTRLDGGAFEAPSAATGTSLNGLTDGPHTFEVRAHDPAGNLDATPAQRAWIVDAQGPVITITAGPAAGQCQTATTATFEWTATDVVSPANSLEYAYALDGAPATAFGAVQTIALADLTEGVHTFTVQARDERGHVTSLARLFRVDQTAPVALAPTTRLLDNATVRVNAAANDDGGVTGLRIQVASDPSFAAVIHDANVSAAGQYDFTGTAGNTYYARAAATDCAGNVGPFGPVSNGSTVNFLPDLVVSGVDTPPSVTSGQVMQVAFTVTNPAIGATSTPQWFDDLYLSPTTAFDGGTATFLARVPNLSYLAQGESYTSTASVTIPLGLEGTFYVVTIADNGGAVPETDGGNNLAVSPPLAVALGTHADLQVTQVVVPPTAFSGDAVNVQWTVANDGTGRTNASEWYDSIVFSDDSTFSFILPGSSNIQVHENPLARHLHTGALDPGQSYSRTETVNVPAGAAGRKYFYVVTDLRLQSYAETVNQRGNVFEHVAEMNNWTASEGMDVTLTPPPDLVVTSAVAPATGTSGAPLAVSWTAKNSGFNATPNQTWTDRIHLSSNPQLDGGDLVLGALSFSGTLAVNGTYSRSGSFPLPQGISGSWYVLVSADVYAQLGEYNEANNVAVAGTVALPTTPSAVAVTLSPYANLVPAYGSVPDTVAAGQSAMIGWAVTNAGTGTLAGNWQDDLYLSTSPTWNPAAATRIAVVGVSRNTFGGQAYSMSWNAGIPTGLAGNYYVYVVADARNNVYEYLHDGDNLAVIGSLYVKPYPPVDLAVSNLVVPSAVVSTAGIPMSWTVTNTGQGTTLASSWNQEIYLSADNLFQPGVDLLVQHAGHGGVLAPGATYTQSAQPAFASGFSGTYYVIVRVDAALASGDGNAGNNVIVSAGPVTISPLSQPNLAVLSVEAPLTGTAGQPAEARFNVSNDGAAALAGATWYWTGYLSQDGLLDNGDLLLGSQLGPTTLAAGGADPETLAFIYPEFASGGYRVLFLVDSRGELAESNEADNVSASPGGASLSQVILPPPADLVVENVTVPTTATPGVPVTVTWSLRNLGPNPANGYLRNAVYMSTDQGFASDLDPLVGVQDTVISLPVGAVQQMSATVELSQPVELNAELGFSQPLPPLSPGPYFALVRANIRNNIRETDATNNGGWSAVTLDAQIAELTLGVPAVAATGLHEARFYKVTVPAGEDLRFSTTTDIADAVNEMYVAFGRTPTLTDFDRSGPAGFIPAPHVVVPGTSAGTYFVMIVNRGLGTGPLSENLSVKAELLPFSITAVTPNHGGQDGRVTSRLTGAQFRTQSVVRLEQSGIPVATGTIARYLDSGAMDVRWNLDGVPLGLYDVVAINGAEMAVAPAAFLVEPAQPMSIEVETFHPDVLRRTAVAPITVRFRNTSNVDVPVLRARVVFPASSQLKGLRVSDGMKRRSDRMPAAFAPVSGDVYVVHSPSGDSLAIVDLWAADVRPDELRTVTLDLAGFDTSPYSVRAMAQPMTVTQFLDRASAEHEVVRQAILADPAGLDPETVALASDAFAFRDSALIQLASASHGLVTSDEALAYVLSQPNGLMPRTTLSGAEGPQPLLDELAAGTCDVPAGVPECEPDLRTLTSALPGCRMVFQADLPAHCPVGGGRAAPMRVGVTHGFVATASANARVVTPCDPNILTGPSGYGDQRWVNANEALSYRVDFENLSGVASAPAQVVSIRLPLDSELDPTTFRLVDVGFGSHVISVPPDRTTYTVEPFYSDLGLRVRVVAGVDIVAHEAFWTLTSIDPTTGQQPTNPYIGFLPPNDPSGAGAGFATFTIRPFGSAAAGAQLNARASIKFDANVPILTVEAVNRLDTRLPSSAVQPTIEVLDSTRIRLQWASSDDTTGAGVASVALYQKQDSGPFQLYEEGLTGTQLEVPVQPGHQYAFYTLATDNTGNREPAKTVADATVSVGTIVLGVEPPRGTWRTQLLGTFPNPARGASTLRFELARPEKVSLEVFDVQGRMVARPLADRLFEAGRQSVRLEPLPVAPGLYFYRFQAGRYSAIRRTVLLR